MTKSFRLKLTGMAHGGEALGRDESGRVVFVPYAIPGEEVEVEPVEERKEFAWARLLQVIDPSPARVTPRCPHFGDRSQPSYEKDGWYERGCGGCQWQHIDYSSQLEFKTQIVRDQFARIAKLADAPVRPMIGGREWNYRNHMRFVLDEEGRMCLQVLGSHDVITIRECHIIDEPLVSLFSSLNLEGSGLEGVTLRAGENTGDRMIVLESNDLEPPEIETDEAVSIHWRTGDRDVTLIGMEVIEERVGERTFRISHGAFFQVNTPMAEILLRLVGEYLSPRSGEVLLDAYGGVGLFGLSLARHAEKVIEVEESREALEDARFNGSDLDNVEYHEGKVEEMLPRLSGEIHLAVVDPPRAGMTGQALEALITRAPRVIVYVSCDPATLARDARRLLAGGYRVTHLQPVDLFPQTFHIECVSRFEPISHFAG